MRTVIIFAIIIGISIWFWLYFLGVITAVDQRDGGFSTRAMEGYIKLDIIHLSCFVRGQTWVTVGAQTGGNNDGVCK